MSGGRSTASVQNSSCTGSAAGVALLVLSPDAGAAAAPPSSSTCGVALHSFDTLTGSRPHLRRMKLPTVAIVGSWKRPLRHGWF